MATRITPQYSPVQPLVKSCLVLELIHDYLEQQQAVGDMKQLMWAQECGVKSLTLTVLNKNRTKNVEHNKT